MGLRDPEKKTKRTQLIIVTSWKKLTKNMLNTEILRSKAYQPIFKLRISIGTSLIFYCHC